MLKKIPYAGCPGLSPAVLPQFTLKMGATARNRKKITKTLTLGVQGHLWSSMLTPLRTSSLVFFSISSMSVPICNCVHAKRANISKITTFQRGTPV